MLLAPTRDKKNKNIKIKRVIKKYIYALSYIKLKRVIKKNKNEKNESSRQEGTTSLTKIGSSSSPQAVRATPACTVPSVA